jgi:hypothetical protein
MILQHADATITCYSCTLTGVSSGQYSVASLCPTTICTTTCMKYASAAGTLFYGCDNGYCTSTTGVYSVQASSVSCCTSSNCNTNSADRNMHVNLLLLLPVALAAFFTGNSYLRL